jgi:hypothetical protein
MPEISPDQLRILVVDNEKEVVEEGGNPTQAL